MSLLLCEQTPGFNSDGVDVLLISETKVPVVESEHININRMDEVGMLRSNFDVVEIEQFEKLTGKFTRSNYCNLDDPSAFPLSLVHLGSCLLHSLV